VTFVGIARRNADVLFEKRTKNFCRLAYKSARSVLKIAKVFCFFSTEKKAFFASPPSCLLQQPILPAFPAEYQPRKILTWRACRATRGGAECCRSARRKVFFSEEKKQKTFVIF
jgi:hypothetical protein